MRFTSLTHHLVLWFIVVALLPLLLFGYLSLQQNEATLRTETQARMSRLVDKKSMEIKVYLAERAQNAQMLARSPLAEQAMDTLSRAYTQHGPDSQEYLKVDQQFRGRFSPYIDESSLFYDILLITPQGEIIYTDKHEADFATNLLSGPYRDSQLARAFRESSMTFESNFSGFETYTPSSAPAAFIAVPIMYNGAFHGVIAFQLSTENVYRVAMDASGLGATGETLLARLTSGDEALFVAPLRHDPEAAMKRRIDMKTANIPMRNALLGQHGGGIETDYSGRQVVAAWHYVPELHWGMVVKMDADEAFAPIYRERQILLQILLALVLLAGGAALYFGRRLVVPLKGFAQTADAVARGDLDRRVAESGLGEIGMLGRAFNHMAGNLQSLYRTLEDRVEERTRELNVSNEQLQEEIIERELIEAALRESEELLTSVMKLLPVGVWIVDAEGKVIFENAVGREIWAGTQQTWAGRGDRKGWRIGGREQIEPHEWASIRAIEKGETSLEEEIEIECFDDTHKIILNSALPLHRDGGGISGAIVVNQDITGRKQIEEQLRASEALLRQTQSLAAIGSWRLNVQKNELVWSDETYRIFGIPAGAVLTYESFIEKVHPGDRGLVDSAWEAALKGVPYHIQHRILVHGETRWVEEHAELAFDAQGNLCSGIGSVQDITERKQVETMLRRHKVVVDTAIDGFWIADANGNLLEANEAYARMSGYAVDELVNMHISQLEAVEQSEDEVKAHIAKIMARGYDRFETRHRRKDGHEVDIEVSVTYMAESQQLFVFCRDISERKRAEAQIAETISLLQATNKALDEFTYIAAHDLKEPLRGIHNYTSFLREDYGDRLDGEAQQYISSIQRLAERLSALIDRLLAYSRLGSKALDRVPVDVDAVVDAVAEDLSRLWMDPAHGGMGIELRRNGRLGVAEGDATRIGEVFQNLISNAAKYNDKPLKWIEVGCDRSGANPVFYVRDNGIGIQPHHQESVFRIFKRLHEQNKYGGGTGAGLTITKKIIELHGGRIWLESRPGEGTVFYFTLREGL